MNTIKILRTLINILYYTLLITLGIGMALLICIIIFPEIVPLPMRGFLMLLNQPFGWNIYLVPISQILNFLLLIIAIFLLRKGTASFINSDFYNDQVISNFKKAGNIFVFIGLSTICINLFTVMYLQNLSYNMMQVKTHFLISTLNILTTAIDLESILAIIAGLFFLLFSNIFENSKFLKQENDLTI